MQEYKEIEPEILAEIPTGECWSIEKMNAHGAGERTVQYVGSRREGNLITDYFLDSEQMWWHGNRAVKDGVIMSMEEYIFGRRIPKESFGHYIRKGKI